MIPRGCDTNLGSVEPDRPRRSSQLLGSRRGTEPACGRRRRWPMREIIEAIFLLRAGVPGGFYPTAFRQRSTVGSAPCARRDLRACHHLVQIATGREPMPSAAVIDSQSVKTRRADAAMTQARRSWAASATPWSNRRSRNYWSMVPTFRIATAQCPCSGSHASGIPLSSVADSAYNSDRVRDAKSSANSLIDRLRDAGWSNGPSRGSTAIAVSPRTSSEPSNLQTRLYAAAAIVLIHRSLRRFKTGWKLAAEEYRLAPRGISPEVYRWSPDGWIRAE